MKDSTLLKDRAHGARPCTATARTRQPGRELSRPATSSAAVRYADDLCVIADMAAVVADRLANALNFVCFVNGRSALAK